MLHREKVLIIQVYHSTDNPVENLRVMPVNRLHLNLWIQIGGQQLRQSSGAQPIADENSAKKE